jgi:hypothetical protein
MGNTSDNLILLKINMAAGHGGASGRYEQLRSLGGIFGPVAAPLKPAATACLK